MKLTLIRSDLVGGLPDGRQAEYANDDVRQSPTKHSSTSEPSSRVDRLYDKIGRTPQKIARNGFLTVSGTVCGGE